MKNEKNGLETPMISDNKDLFYSSIIYDRDFERTSVYSEVGAGKYVPRAFLVDPEPGTMDSVFIIEFLIEYLFLHTQMLT